MQLTVDTGAPMDVEFKMSTVKEEMIINNVDEFFSDDVKKSGDMVKDVINNIAENNDELKNLQFNNKIAKDDATPSNAESVESEKSTCGESSRDDCESKDHSPKSDTNKQNKPEDIDNFDDLIIQHQEPESQNKLNNHSTEENVVKTDTSEMCDNDINEQKSNVIVPKAEVKDQINSDDNKSINNHEDTTNDSKTDSKEITVKPTEITEKTDAQHTNNDTKNPDTESSILDNVIDEVPNKADEKKDHYHEDVAESQRENTVSPILPKLDNDENKSTDSEIVADSTLESTSKAENRTKESEITDSTSESIFKADNSTKESEITDSTSESISKADDSTKESEITDFISESISKADDSTKESEITDFTSESISKADDSTKESEITDFTSESISKADDSTKESEITDSTSESISKADNSTKESEITEESVASTETDIKSSAIEIEDEKINDTETHNDKGKSENVESNVVKDKKKSSLVSKLTNILDLLSDDEEEGHGGTSNDTPNGDKQCISLVDDDDVMLIDEDTTAKEDAKAISNQADKFIPEKCDESTTTSKDDLMDTKHESGSEGVVNNLENKGLDSETNDTKEYSTSKPLLSFDFLNNCKKKLADMTREELEEFCSLKIVDSIMDRCNLSHLKTLIEKMADTVKEYENEILWLSKQNNVLQLAVNSVNDEQKKSFGTALAPLKITRSVGIQVLMTDKPNAKKKNPEIIKASAKPTQPPPIDKTNHNSSVQKQKNKNQSIPVPRLVPAANTSNKTNPAPASNTTVPGKFVPAVNGVRNSSPVQKPEKRSRVQSETVDLTDDEPPLKVTAKSSPASGVRLVAAQNLLPPRPQFVPPMTSPRKVYIPISGPQSQNVRPEQTVVLKTVPPSPVLRPKIPANNVNKVQANTIRMNRPVSTGRHPAPLPDAVKQYQPTSWKALPPAPDLKLSKVENGIVISWKIDGYDEDSYEEITSYQLFAYHETSCPPSTAIWKKIGDVKALPLPMACTLTQFLAGYKYYFAVRAVDIKSRFGPFSLPASILLLNKI